MKPGFFNVRLIRSDNGRYRGRLRQMKEKRVAADVPVAPVATLSSSAPDRPISAVTTDVAWQHRQKGLSRRVEQQVARLVRSDAETILAYQIKLHNGKLEWRYIQLDFVIRSESAIVIGEVKTTLYNAAGMMTKAAKQQARAAEVLRTIFGNVYCCIVVVVVQHQVALEPKWTTGPADAVRVLLPITYLIDDYTLIRSVYPTFNAVS